MLSAGSLHFSGKWKKKNELCPESSHLEVTLVNILEYFFLVTLYSLSFLWDLGL